MNQPVNNTQNVAAKGFSARKVASTTFGGASKIAGSTQGMYRFTKLALSILAFPLLFVTSVPLKSLNSALKGFKQAVASFFFLSRGKEFASKNEKTGKNWFRIHGTKNKWPKIASRGFLTVAHAMEPINFLSGAGIVNFGKLLTASVGKVPIFGLVHKVVVFLHASFDLAFDAITLNKQKEKKAKIIKRLSDWKGFGEELKKAGGNTTAAKGIKTRFETKMKKHEKKKDDAIKEAKKEKAFKVCKSKDGVEKTKYKGKYKFRVAKQDKKIEECRATLQMVKIASKDPKAINERCAQYRDYLADKYKDIPAKSYPILRKEKIKAYRRKLLKSDNKSDAEVNKAVELHQEVINRDYQDTPGKSFKDLRDHKLGDYRAHLKSLAASGTVKSLVDHKITKCDKKKTHLAKQRKRSWVSVAVNILKIAIMVLWIVGTAIFGPLFSLPFAIVFSAVGLISSAVGLSKFLYNPKVKLPEFIPSYRFNNPTWA